MHLPKKPPTLRGSVSQKTRRKFKSWKGQNYPRKRKKRKPKMLNEKEQIERTPGIRRREILWAGDTEGNLRQINVKSVKTEKGFTIVLDIANFPQSHSVVHQHLPYGKEKPSGKALVSIEDVNALSNLMRENKAKVGKIAAINSKRKVVGFVEYEINRAFPEKDAETIIEEWKEKLITIQKQGKYTPKDRTNYHRLLAEHLNQFGIELKIKLTSTMQGYRFNPKIGRFVIGSKISEKWLK